MGRGGEGTEGEERREERSHCYCFTKRPLASVFEVPLVDMTAINKKVLGPCCTETGWII